MKRFKNTTKRNKHYNRWSKQNRSPQGVLLSDERRKRAIEELWKRVESR